MSSPIGTTPAIWRVPSTKTVEGQAVGVSRPEYQFAIGAAAKTARKTPASMNGPNGMRLLRVATRADISATNEWLGRPHHAAAAVA